MKRKILLCVLLFSTIASFMGVAFSTDGTGTQEAVNNIISTTINCMIAYCLISSCYLMIELIVLKKFEKEGNFLFKLINILIALCGIPFYCVPPISIIVKLSSRNNRTKIIVNISLACFMLLAAFWLYILAFSGRARNIEVMPE